MKKKIGSQKSSVDWATLVLKAPFILCYGDQLLTPCWEAMMRLRQADSNSTPKRTSRRHVLKCCTYSERCTL